MSRDNARDNDRERGDKKGGMKMRRAKKKICSFCMDKSEFIDYKDINKLRKYVT